MHKIVVLLVIATAALLAACGPGASSGANKPAPTEVKVELTEFEIKPSMNAFKVGVPYRFVVTNKGTVNHDFSIAPPPAMEGMAGHGGEEDKALVVIKAEDLPPGTTKSVEYTFTQPTTTEALEFGCHVAGHHEAGMFLPITVN